MVMNINSGYFLCPRRSAHVARSACAGPAGLENLGRRRCHRRL